MGKVRNLCLDCRLYGPDYVCDSNFCPNRTSCPFCHQPNAEMHLCEKSGLNIMDPGIFAQRVIEDFTFGPFMATPQFKYYDFLIKEIDASPKCQCWYAFGKNGIRFTSFCKLHRNI